MQSFLKSILLILITVNSSAVYAKKFAVIFAGGGEKENVLQGSQNMFRESTSLAVSRLKANGWEVEIFYGSDIDSRLSSKVSADGTLSVTNIENWISKTLNRIKNGYISEQDQLLIHINTHGHRPINATDPHAISLGNSYKSFELTKLRPLLKALEDLGVKTAIVDNSCYSGATLRLASKNLCVVTKSTSYQVGWMDKDKNINTYFKSKGLDLESYFLRERFKSNTKDFPQISSDQGKMVSIELSDLHRSIFSKIDDYINAWTDGHSDYDQVCVDPVIKTKEQLNRFKLNFLKNNSLKSKSLTGALDKYEAIITNFQNDYDDFQYSNQLNFRVRVNDFYIPFKQGLEFYYLTLPHLRTHEVLSQCSRGELINIRCEDLAREYENAKAIFDAFDKLINLEPDLLIRYYSSKEAVDFDQVESQLDKLYGLIYSQEREYFDWLYKHEKMNMLNKNDPCSSFIL